MPRRKDSSPTKIVPIAQERNSRHFVFVMKKDSLETAEGCSDDANFVQLRHPRSGGPSLFFFSADKKQVQEVLTLTADKHLHSRSWFIDETIIPNGTMYLSTPIDPVFLVLPYLQKASRCEPLDQILVDEEFPEISRLLECSGIKDVKQIADQKGDESLNAYIFNEKKALVWLETKANRVAKVLQAKRINVSSKTAISANFVKTEKEQDSPECYLRYAHGIVSEYLSDELSQKLMLHLNLPQEETKRKEKASVSSDDCEGEAELKRRKVEPEQSEYFTKVEKPLVKTPTISAKEKARAKAATGSKSISSFFKKAEVKT